MNQRERENKQAEVAGALRKMRDAQFKLSDLILKGGKIAEAEAVAQEIKDLTDASLKSYKELVG